MRLESENFGTLYDNTIKLSIIFFQDVFARLWPKEKTGIHLIKQVEICHESIKINVHEIPIALFLL